jgi:hypothetical protein
MQKEEQHLVVELMEDFSLVSALTQSQMGHRLSIVDNAVRVADDIAICDWVGSGAALSAVGTDE